ncbi:L-aspartate oxidase [Candidatus Woesearchaeota archaeon]|nr:L-aspartate oxidase [Candidatus Woesearchaeota archaeon]
MKPFDFLVIGSGIAGLNAALGLAKLGTVALITKKDILESNTNKAQGGIAAVLSQHDSFDSHIADTLRVGDGLCDKTAVEFLVTHAPEKIQKLIDLGVAFTTRNGVIELSREAGHSTNRIVHAKDATGAEVERAMVAQAKNNLHITLFEHHFAVDIILEKGKAGGALVIDTKNNEILSFLSKAVVLATGGAGQLYQYTTNPKIATGDGMAMAYRAGAILEDLEFVQFHPTAFAGKNGLFLISETVRGEGGILIGADKKPFMHNYHPSKDLAPRDIVSRAVFAEQKKGQVVLDITHKSADFIMQRFPMIYATLKGEGIDMTKQPIPITPSAHYFCGGIKTDLHGRTNIPCLYACGECTCTGVHGANRLASNSLLESVVFSDAVVEDCKAYSSQSVQKNPLHALTLTSSKSDGLLSSFQQIIWKNVGIVRTEYELQQALIYFKEVEENINLLFKEGINESLMELKNMVTLGTLLAQAALTREESRGCHFRSDFPEKKEAWERHIKQKK